ncbi:MAG TPA: ornithine cyclodeaminase [Candidatus Saccharimonadales bacterium]|nr:ornithine cyclodeaminase [Candidatus Saccharimonadales bacterium]
MKIITVESLQEIIRRHGFAHFMLSLILGLKRDFSRWETFTNIPRPAMHVPGGVLELMPICDNEKYYSFKYVNCHPKNPRIGKQTVIATGQLSEISTGYPLIFSEMTLLTAFRTAATSALATDLMSRKDSHVLAIIGTGAQSEFQIEGIQLIRTITEVRYFDIDKKAMDKFAKHMSKKNFKLTRCSSAKEAVKGADIVTVCTACKANVSVLKNAWVTKGMHINAIGGDTVGKTELEVSILDRCRIVVEYFDQAFIEGEIQQLTREKAQKLICAQMHELVTGYKKVRRNKDDITLFDAVGIAMEDYTALRLTYELVKEYGIGQEVNITPIVTDPKDLMGTLQITKAEQVERGILTV